MNEDDFPKKCNEILQEEDFYHFFPSDKLHFLKVLATNNPGEVFPRPCARMKN